MKFLSKFSPHAYALLRIVAGLMFTMHGSQKLLGWPAGREPVSLASQAGIGGVIELVGGLMIMFGLLASFAALIASGMMAVAYFQFHYPSGFWPIVNRGELAALYCFLFLYIATYGSGIWSLDRLVKKRA
jgi:putative oxidoreductase